jgi:hypothetical protein
VQENAHFEAAGGLHDACRHGWCFLHRNLDRHKGPLCFSSIASNFLSTDWQRHVLASSGYVELGMLEDAARVLEEIAPEDRHRNEVLGARVILYMAAKSWDMAAAVASHLVKVEPANEAW